MQDVEYIVIKNLCAQLPAGRWWFVCVWFIGGQGLSYPAFRAALDRL